MRDLGRTHEACDRRSDRDTEDATLLSPPVRKVPPGERVVVGGSCAVA